MIDRLDHKLILSANFLASESKPANALVAFECEPTAENLLIYIRKEITKSLPAHIRLISLQLWETRDSYAERSVK